MIQYNSREKGIFSLDGERSSYNPLTLMELVMITIWDSVESFTFMNINIYNKYFSFKYRKSFHLHIYILRESLENKKQEA